MYLILHPVAKLTQRKHIPSDIKWDPDATPPQYTDNGDQVIERGTQLRIKVLGVRTDVTELFSVGSIKEDYLGSVKHITAVSSANVRQVLYDLRRFSQQAANWMHISSHHAPLACRMDRNQARATDVKGRPLSLRPLVISRCLLL